MYTQKLMITFIISLMTFSSIHVLASEQELKPYVGSEAFERMKQLVGSWEGQMDMGKGPMKVTTSYKVTSNGSALIETVFEGAPHEMVTVYHDDSKHHINFTHYCSLANQPKMNLTTMEGNTLTFDLSGDSDIDAKHETHMHAVAITFEGKDQITQQWTKFEAGKDNQTVKVVYSRIK